MAAREGTLHAPPGWKPPGTSLAAADRLHGHAILTMVPRLGRVDDWHRQALPVMVSELGNLITVQSRIPCHGVRAGLCWGPGWPASLTDSSARHAGCAPDRQEADGLEFWGWGLGFRMQGSTRQQGTTLSPANTAAPSTATHPPHLLLSCFQHEGHLRAASTLLSCAATGFRGLRGSPASSTPQPRTAPSQPSSLLLASPSLSLALSSSPSLGWGSLTSSNSSRRAGEGRPWGTCSALRWMRAPFQVLSLILTSFARSLTADTVPALSMADQTRLCQPDVVIGLTTLVNHSVTASPLFGPPLSWWAPCSLLLKLTEE